MAHLAAECAALHAEIACELRLVQLTHGGTVPLHGNRLQVDTELCADALLPHDADLVLIEYPLLRNPAQHIQRKPPEMRVTAGRTFVELSELQAQDQRIAECLDEHAARREIRPLHRLAETLARLEYIHVDLVSILVEERHFDFPHEDDARHNRRTPHAHDIRACRITLQLTAERIQKLRQSFRGDSLEQIVLQQELRIRLQKLTRQHSPLLSNHHRE